MPATHCVYLEDHEEKYGPPGSPLLELSVVGDTAFLAFVRATETNKSRTYTVVGHQMGVSAASLLNHLTVALAEQ